MIWLLSILLAINIIWILLAKIAFKVWVQYSVQVKEQTRGLKIKYTLTTYDKLGLKAIGKINKILNKLGVKE